MRFKVFSILFLSFSFYAQANVVLPEVDSLKMNTSYSNADYFDSLLLKFREPSAQIHTASPYHFSEDSIPEYSDTIYYQRIQQLNTKSPFVFKYNDEVRNYIIYFSSRKAGFIRTALKRQTLFFPMYEQLLDKYQLPMELKYLSVVESALNPNAKSRAGAVGLWQFMPGTGKLYGLKYNSRIDERKNVWEATEAACKHFIDLYAIYKDWNLVLAAYNSGPGNVNKAIKRSGGLTDYWSIRPYLPRETQGYVPAFIAVNYLMTFPQAHNIEIPEAEDFFTLYDTVFVQEKISLKTLAQELDMPYAEIKRLNPQYRKGQIPSSKKYMLTLPLEKSLEFIKIRQEILSLKAVSEDELNLSE